jgi:hypothetical protein
VSTIIIIAASNARGESESELNPNPKNYVVHATPRTKEKDETGQRDNRERRDGTGEEEGTDLN